MQPDDYGAITSFKITYKQASRRNSSDEIIPKNNADVIRRNKGGYHDLEPFQKGRGRPSSQGPTPKEEELLTIVIKWIKQKGYSPTIKELCEAMNVKSSSTVHAHMRKLRSKGYITWDPAKPRSISICGFDRIAKIRPRMHAPSSSFSAHSQAAEGPAEHSASEVQPLEVHDQPAYPHGGGRSLRANADAYASLCRRGVVIPLIRKLRTGAVPFLDEDIIDDIPVPWELVRDDGGFALRVRTDCMSGAGILRGDLIVVRRQEYANSGDIVVAFAENRVVIRRFKNEGSTPVLLTANESEEQLPAGDFRVLGKVTGVLRSLD